MTKKKSKIKIFGWVASISTLSLFVIYFWLQSLNGLINEYVLKYKLIIFIITTLILILLFWAGYLKINAISKKLGRK